MNIRTIILTIMIFGSLIMVTNAETYISYVDDGLGFYKVRDVTAPINKFTYENRVLTINQGDTIIWENDAQKTSFTIISGQNLWDDKVGYLRVGSKLNYKFDRPGKYMFYIKEYTKMGQTIMVNPIDNIPIDTPIITPTVVATTTPSHTVMPISQNNTYKVIPTVVPIPIDVPDINLSDIKIFGTKIPIKLSPTAIASMIVAMVSIFITYRIGRNKKR